MGGVMADDMAWYAGERAREECICGRVKRKGVPFCRRCSCYVPEDLEGALGGAVNTEYGKAYEEVTKILDQDGLL
jgi:hypothetical protein